MKIVEKIKQNENLMRFIETTQERIVYSEMETTSVVVAYYLLLSLFPMIIAFGNILPFLHIDQETALTHIHEVIPETIYQFIGPAVKNLLTQSSGGLLSISALAAFWSASQSIDALQIAMNKAYGVENRKNFLIVRFFSLVVIILFMIAISGVTIVLGLGQVILEAIQPVFKISVNSLIIPNFEMADHFVCFIRDHIFDLSDCSKCTVEIESCDPWNDLCNSWLDVVITSI